MEARTTDYGSIGWTVNHLRHGHRMRRREWREGAFVVLVTPDKSSPVTQRYFALRDADGNQLVWTPTPADLLAADWMLVDEAQPGHTTASLNPSEQAPVPNPYDAVPVEAIIVSTDPPPRAA